VARLVALDGPLQGQTFPIDPGLTLGREKHNSVAMPENKKASRDHAKVWQDGPHSFSLADLGSTNGTSVNDEKVSRKKLKDGDILQVGDQAFRFELSDQDKPAPKPKAEGPRPDLAAVLRGEAKPAAQAPRGALAGGADAIQVKQRILQYQKKENKAGLLGTDVSQTAGLTRWLLILVAVAAFAGLFYVVRNVVAGARSGEAPVEGS
jgi:hypothetical protein